MQTFNTINTEAHYEMRQFPTPIPTISLRPKLILSSHFLHDPRPAHADFLVDKMAVGQDFFSEDLGFPLSIPVGTSPQMQNGPFRAVQR
jgi:hypothetical protein